MEITRDQGSEFIVNEFKKPLIEREYGTTSKPSTFGNTTSNVILEHTHQVLGNLVQDFNITQTYVDKDDPWSVILAESAFLIISITNRLKMYSLVQLLFGRGVIILIKKGGIVN